MRGLTNTTLLSLYRWVVQTNDIFLHPVCFLVLFCVVQGVQIKSIPPGQQWPGFSFALHLLRVQGFYFALLQYSRIQAFTAAFIPSMQLYRQRHKTAYRALQWLFLWLDPFHRQNNTRPTKADITPPTSRWSVSQHRSTSSTYQDTNAPPGRCTGQHSHPIIIRYMKGQRHAPVMDPCQTVQHIADYASPAGSAPPPVQGQPGGWRSGTGSAWHSPPGVAVQQSGRGGRRGTIGGSRRSSFLGLSPDS